VSAGENKNASLYTALGKVIRERRKELSLSQQDLADISGVDRAFLSNVERGTKRPSFGLVSNIAKGLKLKFSRLVSRCENCQGAQELKQIGRPAGEGGEKVYDTREQVVSAHDSDD
jgi:transcriptional regulator with XRE-family HTH domain